MKDPAVLFYTSDFIAGTLTMTDEQRGQYILLLCLQHQKGFLTEKDMLKICKTYDEDIFLKFEKVEGKYYNIRMKTESERRKKYIESRRKNRSNEPKKKKNISKTYDEHMETENITENKDKNRHKETFEKIKDEFELSHDQEELFSLWLKYKSEKGQAYKETGMRQLIKKHADEPVEKLKAGIEHSIENNYSGLYYPKHIKKDTKYRNKPDSDFDDKIR